MISSKTKKMVIMVMAIFGAVVLIAAIFRARKDSSAGTQSFTTALANNIKGVTSFNSWS